MPAQNAKRYMHTCQRCFSSLDVTEHYEMVRAESQSYLERHEQRQTWNGSEPALGILLLPGAPDWTLPPYANTPAYQPPSHCRLCLAPVTDLRLHLRDHHPHLDPRTYRREVLHRAMSEWPQPISPQVLRSRLAAFKEEMCDANFKLHHCASCARQKRLCKLHPVVFPAADAPEPPRWLREHADDWAEFGHVWWDRINDIFNIDNYLSRHFRTEDRLREAQEAVAAFDDATIRPALTFSTVQVAKAWLERVKRWTQNLRRDLLADSVRAPGSPDAYWLLYVPERTPTLSPRPSTLDLPTQTTSARSAPNDNVHADSANLNCYLCKHCKASLSRLLPRAVIS